MSVVSDIMDFEEGLLSEEETVALFKRLIDSGLINHLQGSYQRMAHALVQAGLIDLFEDTNTEEVTA